MEPLRIAAFASSLRRGSLNRSLLEAALTTVVELDGPAVEVDHIDLRSLPLPLFDADLQARDGVPAAAHEIHDRVAAADALLVANPEYNGGYPALFKNTIDWVSRVDMFVFHPRYTGLLSASPGKGGGVRGLAHTKALFENIFVTTHPEAFSLPRGNDAFVDGALGDDEQVRLHEWLDGFVARAVEHRDAREDAA